MEDFLGKFNRVSEEGYENFLTALNLNYMLRSDMMIMLMMIFLMILILIMIIMIKVFKDISRKAATVSSPTLEILKVNFMTLVMNVIDDHHYHHDNHHYYDKHYHDDNCDYNGKFYFVCSEIYTL